MSTVNSLEKPFGRRRKKFDLWGLAISFLLGILAFMSAFPFYNVFISSFGSDAAIAKQSVYLIPTSIDLNAYKIIFSDLKYLDALLVSIFVTVVGTAFNMLLTVSGGYVLSKKIPGRNAIMGLIAFTMFFSGGLIPYYMTVKNYGLIDNIAVLILPVGINTFYLIIAMNFFRSIPESVEESAKIDGANDIYILFKIVLPIALPMLAAIGLYYAVDRWNDWYNAMLFITDKKKFPLQLLLRDMITNMTAQLDSASSNSFASAAMRNVQPERVKMAVIVVTTIPILLVYPFVQKYFAKGIMLGSLKG